MNRSFSRLLIIPAEIILLLLVAGHIKMVNMTNRSYLLFAILVAAGLSVYAVVARRLIGQRNEDGPTAGKEEASREHASFLKTAVPTAALILLLAALGSQAFYARLPIKAQQAVFGLIWPQLNKREVAQIQRGYYENLLSVDWFTSEAMEKYRKPVDWWPSEVEKSGIEIRKDNFLRLELAPGKEAVYYGQPFHTNQWGMRDKDYDKEKPPGTYRIALLGPSIVLGWGVADNETFESVLEDLLNERNRGDRFERIEILNFAVSDYCVLQQLMILEDRVFPFEPDMVIYTAHLDKFWSGEHLAHCVHEGIPMPFAFLEKTLEEAGIKDGAAEVAVKKDIKAKRADIVYWAYRRLVTLCQERGIVPVWAFVPLIEMTQVDEEERKAEIVEVARLADVADFVVINLADVFDAHEPISIKVAEWDSHPNALGHRLIAHRLFEELVRRKGMLSLGLGENGTGGP